MVSHKLARICRNQNPIPTTKSQARPLPRAAWLSGDPRFSAYARDGAMVEGDKILIEDHPITHGYHGPAWILKDLITKVEGKDV